MPNPLSLSPSTEHNDVQPHAVPTIRAANSRNSALAPFSKIANAQQVEVMFARLETEMENYDDARLVQLAMSAEALERCAFRLRGMIAYELKCRVTQRLAGGRGRRDIASVGIKSKMYELAAQTKVSYSTLDNDARIYETFFASKKTVLAGEVTLSEATLPRDFYLSALALAKLGDDKLHTAIDEAARRLREGNYTREEFRQYVRELAGRDAPVKVARDLEKGFVLRERITKEVKDALARLAEARQKAPVQIIEEAILAQLKMLEAKSTKSKSSLNSQAETNKSLLDEELLSIT
jgi:predicted transcriptional regulator